MGIGERLTQLRKKYGYTQKELADRLHLSQQIVSNIEREITTADINFLRGLADLYEISLDELVGRQLQQPVRNNVEQKIMSIIEQMDDTGKELSLGLVNQVAQHRGNKDAK